MATPAGGTSGQGPAAKQLIRERIWARLEQAGVALPPGARGRIPNFLGADAAAERLASLPEWRAAEVIKANPDRAQIPVRAHALRAGKVVYMAVPALSRDHPFITLDPGIIPAPVDRAADKDRALAIGEPTQINEMRRVDLAVAGSVAVNREGARVGKGGGFSDIEIALLVEGGVIGSWTTIAATVHSLQVVDGPLPETSHDFRLDVIVTPDEVIRAVHPRPSPGIIWDDLTPEKIAAIPVLAARPGRPVCGS